MLKVNQAISFTPAVLKELQEGMTVLCNGDSEDTLTYMYSGKITRITPEERRVEIFRNDGQTGGGIRGSWIVLASSNTKIKILILDTTKVEKIHPKDLNAGDIIQIQPKDNSNTTESAITPEPKFYKVLQNHLSSKIFVCLVNVNNLIGRIGTSTQMIIFQKSSNNFFKLTNFEIDICHRSGCKNKPVTYAYPIGFVCKEHKTSRDYIECGDCGAIVHVNYATDLPRHSNNHIVHRYFCAVCGEVRKNRNKPIKSYSYKPIPAFISVRPQSEDLATKLFEGCEVETEVINSTDEVPAQATRRAIPTTPRRGSASLAEAIVNTGNSAPSPPVRRTSILEEIVRKASRKFNSNPKNWFYAKHDGSIHHGFEIVTEPATLEAHQTIIPWKDFFAFLKSQGCDSETNVDTCGLHIHANKDILNEAQRIKLGLFVNVQRRNMEKLARRSASRWAQFKPEAARRSDLESFTRNETGGKYEALNWIPLHTVEFRLFKGTLNSDILISSLELVQAAILFAALPSTKIDTLRKVEVGWGEFLKYVNEKGYSNLLNYMKERGTI